MRSRRKFVEDGSCHDGSAEFLGVLAFNFGQSMIGHVLVLIGVDIGRGRDGAAVEAPAQ